MRLIQVFAGVRGLGIGVSEAGFSPARIVEWECCVATRIAKTDDAGRSGGEMPREGDVCDVDFRDFAGKIEFVTGAMLAMTRRRLAEAEVHPVSRRQSPSSCSSVS